MLGGGVFHRSRMADRSTNCTVVIRHNYWPVLDEISDLSEELPKSNSARELDGK